MKLWPFHRHRFFEVDRTWLESVLTNRQTNQQVGVRTPLTCITERCADNRCGKWRQHYLKGFLPGGRVCVAIEQEVERNS